MVTEPASGEDPATPAPTDEATPAPTEEVLAEPGRVELEPIWGGLQRPVDLDPIPGEAGRYLLVDQSGVVLLLNETDAGARSVAGDLTDRVRTEGVEEGLLGLAFSPDDSSTLYLYYIASDPHRSVLSRFSFDGTSIDVGAEQVLYEADQPEPNNHKGGALAFGPDGYLYLGLGDGGSQGDPDGNGQNPAEPLASILRFDVSGDEIAPAPDNPFVGQEGGPLEEVYAWGLRNPWRFSFDRETGVLWAGDVGGSLWEEVNRIEAGGNYGWSVMEGPECLDEGGCDQSGLVLPHVVYGHDVGCSITGGYVYRGELLDSLRGWYVYSDYCSGRIWAVSPADGSQVRVLKDDGPPVVSFAEDTGGELFVLTFDGNVSRLVAA